MYKIVKERRAWWPVVWLAAAEDGGEVVENRIEMRFRILGVDDAAPLVEEADRIGMTEGVSASTVMATLILKLATDWRGVGGENGEALPWNAENVGLLMNVHGTFDAVLDGYRRCLAGQAETRLGN